MVAADKHSQARHDRTGKEKKEREREKQKRYTHINKYYKKEKRNETCSTTLFHFCDVAAVIGWSRSDARLFLNIYIRTHDMGIDPIQSISHSIPYRKKKFFFVVLFSVGPLYSPLCVS